MEYPPEFNVVEVVIEVDTSAFEAALTRPLVAPIVRLGSRDFDEAMRWVNQTFEAPAL